MKLSTSSFLKSLVLCLVFCISESSAQVLNWRDSSDKTFVFEISNKDAEKYFRGKLTQDKLLKSLENPLTSYVEKWENMPDQGHFILARIKKHEIQYEYFPVYPFQVFLYREYDMLTFQVVDKDGKIRSDAKVKIKGSWFLEHKNVRYNSQTKTYSTHDLYKEGSRLLIVELDGFQAMLDLRKDIYRPYYGRGGYPHIQGKPDFFSYMITDKNKYKPGEKVRFKSYALNTNRQPLTGELSVWLYTQNTTYKKVGTVSPYNPGGYAGEIQLHDSLKMRLDSHYPIQLRDKDGRIIASSGFYYEDYELYDSSLRVNLKNQVQYFPESNALEIHATDANGLTLKDARAEILVTRLEVKKVYVDRMSLPDSLMYKKLDLDNDKATNFDIPASIFGNADVDYRVKVMVITYDNQRMEQNFYVQYYRNSYEIRMAAQNDSVRFSFFELGKEKPIEAEIMDTKTKQYKTIQLPYIIPFDQSASSYWVKTKHDEQAKQFFNHDNVTKLDIEGGFESDSLNIKMINPLGVEMSWYIYQGGILRKKGFGKGFDLRLPKSDLDVVHYIEAFYRIGENDQVFSQTFTPRKDMLSISVNLPEKVYPGQKIDATISVRDAFGKPAAGVDLTAIGVNSLLNYYLPELPYFGNEPKNRDNLNYSYQINRQPINSAGISNYGKRPQMEINEKNTSIVRPLDFDKWREAAMLDRNQYYQFTYPRFTTFTHTVSTIDSVTQFAPYVMKDGQAINAYVITDNGKPVYFSWTNNTKGYSFPAADGTKHQISIRLHDRIIFMDSIAFEPGKKTILSIDADHLPMTAREYKLENKDKDGRYIFTPEEESTYSPYISEIPIKDYTQYQYLTQNKTKYPIFIPFLGSINGYGSVLSGPIPVGESKYMNSPEYLHEGGFRYQYAKNVVYKYPRKVVPEWLTHYLYSDFKRLNDFHITDKVIDSTINKSINTNRWHPRAIQIYQKSALLNFRLPVEADSSGVSGLLLIDPKNQTTYQPSKNIAILPYGVYNAIVLYNNGKYLRVDSVEIKARTYTDINMAVSPFHAASAESRSWPHASAVIYFDGRTFINPLPNPAQISTYATLNNYISGTIVDEYGDPLAGAAIYVKDNPKNYTHSDIDGNFSLGSLTGTGSTISVTSIGYESLEVTISNNSQIHIVMKEYYNSIDDQIVVMGYGSTKRTENLYLSGHVSEIQVQQSEESSAKSEVTKLYDLSEAPAMRPQALEQDSSARAKGESSEYIEEGVALSEDAQSNASVDEAEQRLYAELMLLNGLRSNFSDVGFWEPSLFTDKNGKANFSVTFPDNITKWDAVIFAMNRKLQTGTYRTQIKSYKPLMAELRMPQFMVAGDSSYFAGNIRNYTSSKTINGNVIFAHETDTLFNKNITFETSHQDFMRVVAPDAADSIRATYIFTRDDGYNDGEKRAINIVPQGTLIANGILEFLRNGDKVEVKAGDGESVHVRITGKQLDVYLDATEYLRGYQHACNEQLASKLIGLVNYKIYAQFTKERFKYDRNVNDIITRLTRNQNDGKLWSWWGNSSATSYWMSAHVMRALKMAKDNGYAVSVNVENIEQDYINLNNLRHSSIRDIEILHALSEWGTKQNYAPAIEKFENEIRKLEYSRDSTIAADKKKRRTDKRIAPYNYHFAQSYLKEKLMLWEIRQHQGLAYPSDSIAKYLKKDVLGLVRCDDGLDSYNRYWYADNLQTTLIAYRIIKRDSALMHHKEAMQMYILGTKHNGWNTYQASSAVATIMPDLIAESMSKDNPATVILRGKETLTLTKPSYETILQPGESLAIEKVDGMPLIYTAYTIKRVHTANSGEAFEVTTKLNIGDTITAGEPVTLTAKVKVKQKNAEHVMIEIPIPAGCSYESKTNYMWRSHEVHREYFKEKTVIFCEKLPEGEHEFTIKLLPRYTGRYNLNPAKVEMMYFPTINANNDQRKVEISERIAPEER